MDIYIYLVAVTLVFALGIAFVGWLTFRQNGPFAFILARLSAKRNDYVSVATMLWAVVAGLIALPFLAYAWPEQTAAWGSAGFVFLALLTDAVRSALSSRAPS